MDGNGSSGKMDKSDSELMESVESLLDAIKAALNDPQIEQSEFINEFGDYSIAIPLSGDQESLNSFMKKQELKEGLAMIAERVTQRLNDEGIEGFSCCFTGHRPKRVPWLSDDDDSRTAKLRETLRSLIDNLSLRGAERYIAGNADGFDTLAAEEVLDSNAYLEEMREIGVVREDWAPAKLEIAVPFEGHNADDPRITDVQNRATTAHVVSNSKERVDALFERNEYMVDNSDVVIALLNDDDVSAGKSGSFKTVKYALSQGKIVVVIKADWFETSWPKADGISVKGVRAPV